MSLTSTQLPPLHGAEHHRRAVLQGKRTAFRLCLLLIIAATLPSLVVSLSGEPNFPGRWAYWLTNTLVIAVSLWALVALRRIEQVRLVERVGLVGSVLYLLVWDMLAFAAKEEPRAEFLMTNAAALLLASALICLAVERRALPYTLLGVFAVHEVLTWGNLLHFPWGSAHNAQLTCDLMLVVTLVFLNLIGSFQHLLSTSQQETELVRLLVNTDELTGLANARSLSAQLGALPQCAVLLLEIDDFEGWLIDVGADNPDEVYCRVARTLRRVVGKHGSCGRWGQTQFVVLLPYAERGAALDMAEELRRHLMALDFGEPFTLSVGVAVAGAQVGGLDLLHRAARRLERAKASGGDQVVAGRALPRGEARAAPRV